MVSNCVDLTSVYSIKVGTFALASVCVCKCLLFLIFPPHNKLHKLFNRNNVKISQYDQYELLHLYAQSSKRQS